MARYETELHRRARVLTQFVLDIAQSEDIPQEVRTMAALTLIDAGHYGDMRRIALAENRLRGNP